MIFEQFEKLQNGFVRQLSSLVKREYEFIQTNLMLKTLLTCKKEIGIISIYDYVQKAESYF